MILNSTESVKTNHYTKLCAPQQQQSLHSSVQFTQSQSQTQTPRTLATMAGIQLTGADEHVSPSSMSGATPTATVEEINVPVFIDEYLKQPADTTTAATTTTTYSLNSNSSSNSQNCRQSNSSGIGSNANNNCNNYNNNTINGNGFEEDFDFDMEMFANSSDVEVFEDNNTNSNNFNNNNGNNIADIDDTFESCFSNKNNNNSNIHMHTTNAIKSEISEDLSQQYHILWDQLNVDEWLTSQELVSNMESVPDLPDISENAVNFNNINIKELDDFLLNSQNPMLSCATICCSGNNNNNNMSNSQQIQMNLIANSEPFVPKIEDQDDIFCDNNSIFVTEAAAVAAAETPASAAATATTTTTQIMLPVIATTTHNESARMKQKRLKLLLPSAPVADSLSTPTVLGGIVDLQDEKMAIESSIYLGNSIANIEESLKDDTSHFTYTDEDSPSTPRSCYSSFTTCTNEYSATPYSPAPSNISCNQQTSNTSKRKRGRPAKEHSDQPDPAKLKNMPDIDRKKLLDRAKNNEASRVSRKKNKEREEQEKEIECKLIERNLVLRSRRKDLVKIEKKLKRALMRGAIFTL